MPRVLAAFTGFWPTVRRGVVEPQIAAGTGFDSPQCFAFSTGTLGVIVISTREEENQHGALRSHYETAAPLLTL